MLAGARLIAALNTENRIFRAGTWDPGQIHGAGYQVRLADNRLAFPGGSGSGKHVVIGEDGHRSGFALEPGGTALVSTQERFSLDFTISALIGPRFRSAIKGLLVLHGMVAHPGFGRRLNEDGEWVPKEDERLCLVIINVGSEPEYLRAGDPIAYLQFFEVDPVPDPVPIKNAGFDDLYARLFESDSAGGGLGYFKIIYDVQRKVDDARLLAEKQAEEYEKREKVLQVKVDAAVAAVDRVRNSTDNVVVFGVFLVAVTLLGVVLTTLVGVVQKIGDFELWKVITVAALSLVFTGTAVAGVWLVAKSARKGLESPVNKQG
ncbi:hypothetical protein Acsp05_11400 [Actinokineospora sp. NBRC 105648]|nr:hypothetical protein Acsp05_11400 [Actinokineospora sp. NBRC 105648]